MDVIDDPYDETSTVKERVGETEGQCSKYWNILYRDEDARGRVTGRMFQCIVGFEFVCLCDFILTFLYGKVITNYKIINVYLDLKYRCVGDSLLAAYFNVSRFNF